MKRGYQAILLASVFTGVFTGGAMAPARAQTLSYGLGAAGQGSGPLGSGNDDVTYGSGDASAPQLGVTGAAAAPSAGVSGASGNVTAPSGAIGDYSGGEGDGIPVTGVPNRPYRNPLGAGMSSDPRLTLHPYIEAGQVAYTSPSSGSSGGSGTDVLTYSDVAVGVDARINGNHNQGTVSVRYEHQFGWGPQNDANIVSGLAQMSSAIVPGTLRFDYGGYANQNYVTAGGVAMPGIAGHGASSQMYAAYGGPTLTTHAGVADVQARYYLGYAGQGQTSGVAGNPNNFSSSLVQNATGSISVKPGQVAPVGFGLNGGWYQEDVSPLSQRIKDEFVRGSVTVPVTPTLHLVAGVGYEHGGISSRNAEIDGDGAPAVGANGQYVTDAGAPRTIAFDFSDLLWDVGVQWRPSPRTVLNAYYGRRYGANGMWGDFSWRLDARQQVHALVYNNLVGLGGGLINALAGAPSDFVAISSPISGNLIGCVATLQSGGCLASQLGPMNGAAYHDRGVTATYGLDFNHVQTGIGLGYDRRDYITAPGTVLASLDGEVSQYWWMAAYVSTQPSRDSRLTGAVNLSHFQGNAMLGGDMTGFQAIGTYSRNVSRHLTASASLAIDSITIQSPGNDTWSAAGAFDVRYTF